MMEKLSMIAARPSTLSSLVAGKDAVGFAARMALRAARLFRAAERLGGLGGRGLVEPRLVAIILGGLAPRTWRRLLDRGVP